MAGKSSNKGNSRTSGRGRQPVKKKPGTSPKAGASRPSGGSRRLTTPLAVIAVCGLVVGLNNAGVIPANWRDYLVIGRQRNDSPQPVAEPDQPQPVPQPTKPRPWVKLPALPVPAAKPPKPVRQQPEPRPAEPKPAEPKPKAEPKPEPAPEAVQRTPRADGELTTGQRRERLVDVTPPDGFTTEWRGGAAMLKTAANEIARGNPNQRRVALTMDGCWEAAQVPAILEILKSQGVRVTFFLTGTFASKYPDAVRQIAAAGHEVANHSWDHPELTKLDDNGIDAQIGRTERELVKLAPKAYMPFFRPPFGDRDVRVLRHLIQQGVLPVYWTVDTLDWKPEATPESVLDRIAAQGLEPGAIILCHVASKPTLRALPRLIVRLRAADLEPGPLSRVLVP